MMYKSVGVSKKRYDGPDHVTGKTRYVDDVIIPGTLTVKVLRSPIVKGRIKYLNIQNAAKTAGIAGVITADDVPNNIFGFPGLADQPVLAREIRHRGEPIAAVAAIDEDTAMEAVNKIQVEFEGEPYVIDPILAMKPDAPKVRSGGNLYSFTGKDCIVVACGDIEKGFNEADVIIEKEYIHQSFEHAALETQCALAVPGPDGTLTVYTVSQAPYVHINELSSILKMPVNKIRFIGGTVGGGFGGKGEIHADHIASILALKTGKPVKWRWTREEEFLYSTHRGAYHVLFKDGIKKDGRITARQVISIRDAGAYTSFNPGCLMTHCNTVHGPYNIPNVHVKGYLVYTNKATAMAMRGFGVNEAIGPVEMQMNYIAKTLNIDPWEIRFINAYRNMDSMPVGQILESVSLIEVMKLTAEKAGVSLPAHLTEMTSDIRN